MECLVTVRLFEFVHMSEVVNSIVDFFAQPFVYLIISH